MNVLLLVPLIKKGVYVQRDLAYGCWCWGKRVGGSRLPPLNMMYLSAILKQAGQDVELVDAQSVGLVSEKIAAENYDLVVIATSDATIFYDLKSFEVLKQNNPNIKTLFIGPEPTFNPSGVLENEIVDYIISGEPEYSLKELVLALDNASGIENIRGLGYRDKENRVVLNPVGELKCIHDLPYPDRECVKGISYYNPLGSNRFTTMLASRGCNFGCSFCTSRRYYGGSIRRRTVNDVVDEMQILSAQGYEEVIFRDENLATSKFRLNDLCNEMIKRKLKMSWICNLRPGIADMATLKMMKLAGCHYIMVGVESGSEKVLQKLSKGVHKSQIVNMFDWMNNLGIKSHAHFIFGNPGETEKDIYETIDFIRLIRPTTIDIGIMTPFRGSDLFEKTSDRGFDIIDSHLRSYSDISSLSGKRLKQLVKKAYSSFYLRPHYILSRVKDIRSLADARRLFKSGFDIALFTLLRPDSHR